MKLLIYKSKSFSIGIDPFIFFSFCRVYHIRLGSGDYSQLPFVFTNTSALQISLSTRLIKISQQLRYIGLYFWGGFFFGPRFASSNISYISRLAHLVIVWMGWELGMLDGYFFKVFILFLFHFISTFSLCFFSSSPYENTKLSELVGYYKCERSNMPIEITIGELSSM